VRAVDLSRLVTKIANNRVNRDFLKVMAGNVAPAIFALLCIPGLLENLGSELYGYLVLLWAIAGYLGFLDLGIGKSATYKISSDFDNRQNIFGSALSLSAIVSLILMGFVFLSTYLIAYFEFSNDNIRGLLLGVVLIITPTVFTSVIRGSLEGINEFTHSSVNKSIVGSLFFLIPWLVSIYGEANIENLVAALILARAVGLGHICFCARKSFDLKFVADRAIYRQFFQYGSWVSVSSIVGPLMVYGDRFLISLIIGIEKLPIYSIPQEVLQRILVVSGSYANALLPKITILEKNSLLVMYKKTIFYFILISAPIFLGIHLALPYFFAAWISLSFSIEASGIASVILLGVFLNSIAQITLTFNYACGLTKSVAVLHLVELFFYFILLYFLLVEFSIFGAAIAWAVRVSADLIFMNFILFNKRGI
jgi:O-antigen/teichoic acid export membrane protein